MQVVGSLYKHSLLHGKMKIKNENKKTVSFALSLFYLLKSSVNLFYI